MLQLHHTMKLLRSNTLPIMIQKYITPGSVGAVQLVSARHFAVAKKQKKKGKKGPEDQNFELMLRTIKGRYNDDVKPLTEEEIQRNHEIGRQFNIMSTIQHNHWARDIQTKIDLKWEAINALPLELRAEALEPDYEPVPQDRGIATWTPPVEGFLRFSDDEDQSQ